jgi:hypothetical protein
VTSFVLAALAATVLFAGQGVAATEFRPIVLLESNYYTFVPGDKLQLRVTIDPAGYTAPVTTYLYWQDRNTGTKRYYNLATGALLAPGEVTDLFGQPGAPVPITLPSLTDYVLFGSASDPATLSFGADGAIGPSITVPSGQTGLYQYVLEVRDASGTRVLSRSNAMYSYITGAVTLTGNITSDLTLTADKRWILQGFVIVKEPAELTIEPGTVIYGGDTRASLFITRGAKIMADGTAMRPIIMTSPQKTGARAQRNWGSLIVFGRAPINEPGGQAYLEGLPAQADYQYGGSDPNDNSGVIRYVRLEFGGFEIEVNQEINGLTLGGVGRGTVIDYLQVHMNKDDAIEFFGGTVNAKHMLFTGIADDGVDWDLGYVGNVQYVVNIKSTLNDENDGNLLLEGDNHPQNYDLLPRCNPQVYNITAIGTGSTTVGAYGAVMRRGTAGKVHNAIAYGSRRAPFTIRDDASWNQVNANELVVDNSILYGSFEDSAFASSSDRPAQLRGFLFVTMENNRNADPRLAFGAWHPLKFAMPDVTPLSDSPALDINYVKTPPDNGFFDTSVDAIGGVLPGNNWPLTGWAVFSDN